MTGWNELKAEREKKSNKMQKLVGPANTHWKHTAKDKGIPAETYIERETEGGKQNCGGEKDTELLTCNGGI